MPTPNGVTNPIPVTTTRRGVTIGMDDGDGNEAYDEGDDDGAVELLVVFACCDAHLSKWLIAVANLSRHPITRTRASE